MESLGLICEWNPFHNGHAYLLEEARRKFPEAVIVAVMSGNFVQRGEPAIISKRARSETALKQGADLVVELPLWWATQAADGFAKGAVSALTGLDCQSLIFGVEDANFTDYINLAQWEAAHPKKFESYLQASYQVSANMSYAERRHWALNQAIVKENIVSASQVDFQQKSNTLLAYAYIREASLAKQKIAYYPIQRIGAQHRQDDTDVNLGSNFMSGSQIRRSLIEESEVYRGKLPLALQMQLEKAPVLGGWTALYPYLRYRLLTTPISELSDYYQVEEGIEYKMLAAAKQADNMTDFIGRCRNRNWSVSRLQRAALMLVLGVKKTSMAHYLAGPQPLNLLGMTSRGQSYLKTLNKATANSQWQLISRVNRQCEKMWPLWLNADRLYSLIMQTKDSENIGRQPIIIKKKETDK
ncbi:nucleotidyltransferase family protein [Aerococcus sp. YH-aer221]|uniref:tRNA(Met) cytidine acetate ligase n=1 Tax=Aerococcus kribbianus TaxID=2999064 RepID=UPI002285E35A|nr:nucleotidyltransferase family protein [Aerococcus sp. YH-aer221]MCZ0717721.1 nucleotidyltransferase family protein [Aerococcus sp. YH-aer221]